MNKQTTKDILSLRNLHNMKRFAGKVKLAQNGCVEWTGMLNETGYGRSVLGRCLYMAHRVSWVWANNQNIPENGFICHSCDNRKCVNPEHLWIGDYMQNYYDSVNKGRQPIVSGHKMHSRFSDDDVRHIRAANDNGQSIRSLSREYGVEYCTIRRICRGITYSTCPPLQTTNEESVTIGK